MTVADVIRNMTDIELAQFLEAIISERDQIMSEKLAAQGVQHSLIEMPALSVMHHLQFLRRSAEEVFELEDNDEE